MLYIYRKQARTRAPACAHTHTHIAFPKSIKYIRLRKAPPAMLSGKDSASHPPSLLPLPLANAEVQRNNRYFFRQRKGKK